MIPVTTFKDKRVALFGLGGSGLATARALVAGGADGSSPGTTIRTAWKLPRRKEFRRPIFAGSTGGVAALVLSPGVPLTHPKPHWTVDLARAARSAR